MYTCIDRKVGLCLRSSLLVKEESLKLQSPRRNSNAFQLIPRNCAFSFFQIIPGARFLQILQSFTTNSQGLIYNGSLFIFLSQSWKLTTWRNQPLVFLVETKNTNGVLFKLCFLERQETRRIHWISILKSIRGFGPKFFGLDSLALFTSLTTWSHTKSLICCCQSTNCLSWETDFHL